MLELCIYIMQTVSTWRCVLVVYLAKCFNYVNSVNKVLIGGHDIK